MARLLGRAPAGEFTIAVRRRDGTPAVIENAPLLDDGRPMPTRYWLVDVELRDAVSRLEAAGGVKHAEALGRRRGPRRCPCPPWRRSATGPCRRATPAPGPRGAWVGPAKGVKCLHAHLAWYLAGGDDPVGRWTVGELGLDVTGYGATVIEPNDDG